MTTYPTPAQDVYPGDAILGPDGEVGVTDIVTSHGFSTVLSLSDGSKLVLDPLATVQIVDYGLGRSAA